MTSSSFDELLAEMHARLALGESSALSSIFGLDIAVQITFRIARHAWNLTPATARPTIDVFTKYCCSSTHATSITDYDGNSYGHLMRCVPFLSHPFIEYFDAPTYGIGTSAPYIVDAGIPAGYAAIPSTLFAPYAEGNPQRRSQSTQNHVPPLPIWFFEHDPRADDYSFGLSIERAYKGNTNILYGRRELNILKRKTSLKMRFNWPRHTSSEKQIRGTKKSPMHSIDRLAQLTAGAVRNFMIDQMTAFKGDRDAHPWSIGTGTGEIGVQDVLLLGVLFVSDGTAMPLLASCLKV
ncbi:unnamed protein product [Peniophora sp. CBMAI 1063]|nr:unnamed protein product [Peniophora sp. CBMAI 1063]